MTQAQSNYYYSISNDIEHYPDAWCYIIVGGRATGKTYSTLKDCLLNDRPFVFLKRTNEDVDLLCAGSGHVGNKTNEYGVDLSPFKSINRDLGTDIRAYSIKKGLGGFWKHLNGDIEGTPIGYLLSLNSVTKFKGFDLSECEWLIFDEFIPNIYDRVNRREGEQLLDLYKTVARDREHRGLQPLKLICLANATSISNPVMNILEITDDVANMEAKDIDELYLEERGIFIHKIPDNTEFAERERQTAVYKALGHTAWGQMSQGSNFAYNDFSNIGRVSLKGYRPVCAVSYKTFNYYIYQKEGQYFMCSSKHNSDNIYNLNRENDQKLFYTEWDIDLRNECIEGNMIFESYSMYDLIVNYKKFFKI